MPESIGYDEVVAMLRAASAQIVANHEMLGELDSHGGDGDHGTTIKRAMGLVEQAIDGASGTDLKGLLTAVGWGVMGVDGGTNATSGVVPELTRRLYDLTTGGLLEEAKSLQFRLLELFDTMLYSADFPEGFRAAVSLRGFDLGQSRQPLSESQQTDRATLSRVLHCILADFDVVDAPTHACPAGEPQVDRDQVARVAQQVIDELHSQGVL